MPKKLAILFAYFLIYVVWGSTYYFIGVALHGFPTFLLGALRFSTAGLILLVICACRGERVFIPRLVGRSAVSGIILLFIDMAVVMLAQRYVSSSLVAVVASSTAIWIMTLDAPMWKYTFRSKCTLAGILMGFAVHDHSEYGILLLVAGCISWALGTLYTKYRSSDTEPANAFAGSAWQMLFAGMMFWICTLGNGEFSLTGFSTVPLYAWLSLAYLILFGSLMAYSAYVWLLKIRPTTEVGTHAYVNPVVAVVIGGGLGGEQITGIQLLGLVIILGSVMLVNKKERINE